MMTPNSSLLQWLATFELDGGPRIELNNDAYYNLADGYICAKILNIISPQYFSDKWLDGIKPVPPNGSWRLRVSNLKRILQKIHDYASDLQSSQFRTSTINPEVGVIAQNFDPDQISRLIQLILFCAINSDKKKEYIARIQDDLPTQVKEHIKEAIEELLVVNNNDSSQKLVPASQLGNDSVNMSDSSHQLDISSSNPSQRHNASSFSPQTTTITPKSTSNRSPFRRNSSQPSNELSRRNDGSLFNTSSSSTPRSVNDNSSTITNEQLRQRLTAALSMKDEKAQACHELEIKVKQLQLEKEQMLHESDKLKVGLLAQTKSTQPTLRHSQGSKECDFDVVRDDSTDRPIGDQQDGHPTNLALEQNRKLQSMINSLKEQIIKLESEKEDYRLKSSLLREDLDKITLRHDEYRTKAEQAKRLQDELDEHKHISEKIVNYETTVKNFLKKNNDLKKEIKTISDSNLAHIHKTVKLEEENNQLRATISQVDIYKRQLHDAQVQLSQETHRADKAEVELTRLSEKYTTLKLENEKLYENTNRLMQGCSSHEKNQTAMSVAREDKEFDSVNLAMGPEFTKFNRFNEDTRDTEPPNGGEGDNILGSMSGPQVELKERIARLECENELLQSKLSSKRTSDQTLLGGLLESSNARCSKLELENRQSKKRIMLLESKIKDLMSPTLQQQSGGASTSSGAGVANYSSSDNALALMNRVEELQRLLFQKEQELMESEAKYRKNLHKAREVFKKLNSNQSLLGQGNASSSHPSCMSSASSFNSSSLDETNLLKQQLKEREDRVIAIEREFYEYKRIKEIHERLIMSAFYGLTTPMQWKNAEKRLERTTLTSPPNTANSSISHSSKH